MTGVSEKEQCQERYYYGVNDFFGTSIRRLILEGLSFFQTKILFVECIPKRRTFEPFPNTHHFLICFWMKHRVL